MQAAPGEGQLWLFGDVFAGRCDVRRLGDVRGSHVHVADARPKMVRRLVAQCEGGGRALIVLFRSPAEARAACEVEIRDPGGRCLTRFVRQPAGAGSAHGLHALLDGLAEADALSVLRGILATSRATAAEARDDAGFASTLARIVDLLSRPADEGQEDVADEARGDTPPVPAIVARRRPATGPAPDIHVLRATRLVVAGDDLLLFETRTPQPLPAAVQAWADGCRSRPVPLRCVTLDQQADGSGFAVFALLHSAGLDSGGPRQLTIANGKERYCILLDAPEHAQGGPLLEAVCQEPSSALPRFIDFMIGALNGVGSGRPAGPEAQSLLRESLRRGGRAAGVIEIAGVVPGHGVLVQGWSNREPGAGRPVVVEAESGCECRRAIFAWFPRDDLGDGGQGFIGLIEMPDREDRAGPHRLHLRDSSGWWHVDWLADGQQLPGDSTREHLLAMLPRLHADRPTLRKLRRVARGGFEGRDTLSAVDRPVRMGIDLAVLAGGTGLFLSGWLLDPAKLVDSIAVRSTAGMASGLSQHWTRTARPDLNEGFGADPLFAPHLVSGEVRHGFMAFLPHAKAPTGAEEFYVELALVDDTVHFLPLSPDPSAKPAMVRRLLESFDRADPAASRLIERQIGPLIAATARRAPVKPHEVNVLEPLAPPRRPLRSLVVPIHATTRDFDVNLASFAVDPDFRTTEVVVVAPADLGGPALSALCHQSAFYGLNVRLVVTQEVLDSSAALQAGIEHAACETVVFLSASAFGRSAGWLDRLCRRFDELPGPGLMSPTLLYEDDSIKFAGLHKRPGYDRIWWMRMGAAYPR